MLTGTYREIRNNHLRAIHAMQRQLGLGDTAYRDRLERLTGLRSCADMDIEQLECVSSDFDNELNPPAEPTELDSLVEAYRLTQDNLERLAEFSNKVDGTAVKEIAERGYRNALKESDFIAHEIARLVSEGAR
jgi:hypothetical protein